MRATGIAILSTLPDAAFAQTGRDAAIRQWRHQGHSCLGGVPVELAELRVFAPLPGAAQ